MLPRLTALLILTICPALRAQEIPYTFRAETLLATADVTVLDKRTKAPIENLTAADFRVFDNDREQPITHFSLVGKDDRPLAVVLLVEVLGYDTDVNAKLPDAARRAFAHLRPDDRVAIVQWGIPGDDCKLESSLAQPFTADVARLSATLERIVAVTPNSRDCRKQKTSREERKRRWDEAEAMQNTALHLAVSTLASLQEYRKELIAIDQDLSIVKRDMADTTADDLLHANQSLNAIIKPSFMVGLVKGIARSADGKDYQSAVLQFYADRTGGTVLSPKREDTGKALEDLLFSIRAEYSLGWKPPEGTGFHKIRVELKKKGPLVRHRFGYFPRATPATAPIPPTTVSEPAPVG